MKTTSKTAPAIRLVDAQLALVVGGLLAWEARPAMSSVGTGYGAWERAMQAKGLL